MLFGVLAIWNGCIASLDFSLLKQRIGRSFQLQPSLPGRSIHRRRSSRRLMMLRVVLVFLASTSVSVCGDSNALEASRRKSPLSTGSSQPQIDAVWNVQVGGGRNTKPRALTSKSQASALPPTTSKAVILSPAVHHEEHLMSAPAAVANVLADLCPHGMLPIAYGMAAAGGTGPVLSLIILVVFGALSWYSLVSFARAAEVVLVQGSSNNNNNNDAGESLSAVWERTLPNGKSTKYIPDLGCVALTVGCLLFYSAFIGDLFGSLATNLTFLPSFLQKRWAVILLLHAAPILPLCLKKDLSALQYSSMTGLVGIVYTIYFVAKRLWDGSYSPGGKFFDLMPSKFHPAAQVGFAHKGSKTLGFIADMPPFFAGKGLLILMNMCCVAYACHYNAVKYYMELKIRTVPALQKVMMAGIGGTAAVFACMMLLGYGTFGRHAQALLLNNYHAQEDVMASVARAFTGVAIISGYALMFAGLKAALFSLLNLDKPNVSKRNTKQNTISVILLALIATGACFVTEHELATVIGIVGSIFGSVVIYMFPAFVNNSLLRLRDPITGKPRAQPFFAGEVLFNKAMVVFGVVFAVLGTWISLADVEQH